MDFLRHKFLEWSINSERATKGNTFGPFQSAELSLLGLLPSRALVRFTQQSQYLKPYSFIFTDTVYRTEPRDGWYFIGRCATSAVQEGTRQLSESISSLARRHLLVVRRYLLTCKKAPASCQKVPPHLQEGTRQLSEGTMSRVRRHPPIVRRHVNEKDNLPSGATFQT